MGYIHANLMVTTKAPSEVFRRFVWNIFCSENEHLKHLNSYDKFNAISDLTVVPIGSSNLAQILHMMDKVDGVFNGRNKNGNGNCKKQVDPRLTLEESAKWLNINFIRSVIKIKKSYTAIKIF
ncbi:xenotropic and polytropic retrovirus receptor 1-like [Chrysoperla carnea]|uniref:xenotropic and polytropic retrovirus receptor 1-like n=1 Tax=Chrysoperla carnea TaxID=189513 RepID=UPI001D06D4A7|nr:xenotropic and polytropic retrovirus receptor 1-like [Chrysoperla carnea]XP_044732567.1 xenotropic and polytropic retrovirus receptor 1-like [Chrysoperla carnea]